MCIVISMHTKEATLNEIAEAWKETSKLHEQYAESKKRRDDLIRSAITEGVTMYAIAKHLGISQMSVANIRDNK